jgi:hypothetical protein
MVHELGHHVLGVNLGIQRVLPDLYPKKNGWGDIRGWDAMALGYQNPSPSDQSRPLHMSTVSKAFSGLLSFSTPSHSFGSVPVVALADQGYGASVPTFAVGVGTNIQTDPFYALEARTSHAGRSSWDQLLPLNASEKLLGYFVDFDDRVATIPGNSDAPISQNALLGTIDRAILTPGSDEVFIDYAHNVRLTAPTASDVDDLSVPYVVNAQIEKLTDAEISQTITTAMSSVFLDAYGLRENLAQFEDENLGSQDLLRDDFPVISDNDLHYPEIYRAFAVLLGLVGLLLARRALKSRGRVITALSIGVLGAAGYLAYLSVVTPPPATHPDAWTEDGRYIGPGYADEVAHDLDLHVRCPDGRHVGMNYVTSEYEIQIADAITNGDNVNFTEWILFPPTPENAGCVHSVSARDNQAFLDANPDLASVLGSVTDSYAIYARYIDPATGIFTSSVLADQVIEPGQSVVHAVSGTTDVVIDAGIPDTTPPETTATASGTLWSDGTTYVSDITVTLSASDDASGIEKTLYSLDGGATYVPYAGQIVLTLDGERIVTYYSVDGGGNAEAPKTLSVTIDHAPLAASADITFLRHTVQTGSQPGSTKTPVVSASVKAFSKAAGSCAVGIGFNPRDYDAVLATCAPDHFAVTDAAGHAVLPVAPGDYLFLARDLQTQVVAGVSSGDLALGETVTKFLQVIVRANGTSVPAKTTTHVGSLLHVIEPEYVEWDQTHELYPFVFDAPEGSWGVTVTVSPPEGFTADYPALSTDVTNDYKALQFTLTDIGSCWECGTAVDVEIRHQDRTIHQHHTIATPMTEDFARGKGLSDADAARRGIMINKRRK